MRHLIIFFAFVFQVTSGFTQDTINSDLNLFIDCPGCDIDFIKDQISFVNYVRDVKDSEVYFLITSQTTGSGGSEKTIFVYGQKEFKHISDTVKYFMKSDDTDGIYREKIVQIIKLCLVPYLLEKSSFENIELVYNKKAIDNNNNVDDKWHSWIYNVDFGGLITGERSYQGTNLWSTIRADKVTDEHKIRFSLFSNYDESAFNLSDGWYTSIKRNYSLYHLYVKSLGEHWSIGESFSARSSSFRNLDYSFSLYPTIEYNIFPYSEATRKQLTFKYNIGLRYNDYSEITIYGKEHESLFLHELGVGYQVIEKWGSSSFALIGSSYLHDMSKNNLRLWTSTSWRITKGFSIVLTGSTSLIHDQVELPANSSSPEDILLKIKEVETSFNYYLNFGITYSFGATYNNVVNPRFGN